MTKPTTKTCTQCGETKEIPLFRHRTVDGKRYPTTRCRLCIHANRMNNERHVARLKEASRRTKERQKKARDAGDALVISRNLLHDSRKADRRKGRDHDLDVDFIMERIVLECTYCGENSIRRTLDRIDNNVGHLKTNVVTACIRCNDTRGNMPYDAWMVVSGGMRDAREQGLFGEWTGCIGYGRRSRDEAKLDENG